MRHRVADVDRRAMNAWLIAREDGAVEDYRVDLEPVTVDDASALFDALDQPEVGTYIGGPYAESAEGMASVIARWLSGPPAAGETWLNFVVRLADGTVIGHARATVHDDWAEVAWVLGSAWWGQGYRSEAADIDDAPDLGSYDPGDDVYVRSTGATPPPS